MKNVRTLSIIALCFICILACTGCQTDKTKKTAADTSDTPPPAEDEKDKQGSEDDENAHTADLVTIVPADDEETAVKDIQPEADRETDTDTDTAALPSGGDIDSQIEEYLEKMSIQEKAAQMFIILPEAAVNTDIVTEAGAMTEEAIHNIPVGGFVYMEQNLQSPEQVKTMLETVQGYSMDRLGLPLFTCIDEEGGTVARINGNANFNVPPIGSMAEVGASGDVNQAYQTGLDLGSYLSELGFNVNFAPVADVLSNPSNEVVKDRAFSSDPDVTAEMSAAVLKGLKENGVYGAFKHFPGHGATEGDTHEGYAFTSKTLDDLLTCELIPFERGIQEETDFIMAGHISLPNVIGDDTPASLSYKMLSEILRDQMDYNGIIITDAMNMGAISQTYTASDAAVKAIQAGVDIILMPDDFTAAYQGILDAVDNHIIPEDKINDSVSRILKVKLTMLEK